MHAHRCRHARAPCVLTGPRAPGVGHEGPRGGAGPDLGRDSGLRLRHVAGYQITRTGGVYDWQCLQCSASPPRSRGPSDFSITAWMRRARSKTDSLNGPLSASHPASPIAVLPHAAPRCMPRQHRRDGLCCQLRSHHHSDRSEPAGRPQHHSTTAPRRRRGGSTGADIIYSITPARYLTADKLACLCACPSSVTVNH